MAYSLQYYDLVLVAIAASLLVGVGIGLATGVALTTAVPLLSFIALAIIGHALFVNGPVGGVDDLAEDVDPGDLPGLERVASIID